MKKVFAATLVTVLLSASAAFAFELPATQPVKGTEGPEIRLIEGGRSTQTVKGIEGPDVR